VANCVFCHTLVDRYKVLFYDLEMTKVRVATTVCTEDERRGVYVVVNRSPPS
jgi:hypothetical protein